MAVVMAKSWAVWRLDLPNAGFVDVTTTGAHTGSGSVEFTDSGIEGGGFPVVQAGYNAKGAHEGVGLEAGGGGNFVQQGIHWAGAIIGGGTVSVGGDVVRITAPAGTRVLAFSSGVAIDLTDENFTSGKGLSVDSPAVVDESINGSVVKSFSRGLFGLFFGEGSGSISYTDPSGAAHSGSDVFSWFNGAPGRYVFHANVTQPLGPESTTGAHVRAILADIPLP